MLSVGAETAEAAEADKIIVTKYVEKFVLAICNSAMLLPKYVCGIAERVEKKGEGREEREEGGEGRRGTRRGVI